MELEFKKVKRKPITVEVVKLTEELHTILSGGSVTPMPFEDSVIMLHTKQQSGSIKIGDYIVEARTDTIGEGIDHKHDYYFLIKTLEDIDEKTLHRAEIGDYLVKGTLGELWAVKPEAFFNTYDATPEDFSN